MVFLAGSVSAQYIVGDIYIQENGDVVFDLESDKELGVDGTLFSEERITGKVSSLTDKQGDVWAFTLSLGNYESILIDVHFPKGVESIKAIEGVESAISIDERTISLIDSDKKLFFRAEYTLGNSNSDKGFYFIVMALILVAGYFVFNKKTKYKKRLKQAFPYINDKERKILDLLMKGSMRQKQVREKLEMPKASFSRYIVNLEKKKLIIREGEGKNKVLRTR